MKILLYNGCVHTQSNGQVVDSIVIDKEKIVVVGNNLRNSADFRNFRRLDLKKKMVVPGLVDAHAHLYYFAMSLGRVSLHGLTSITACLSKIEQFAKTVPRGGWIVGEGYSPEGFKTRQEPDRYMLDSVSAGRPAFVFAKDHHSVWVNSKALEIAGITSATSDPKDGEIVRFPDKMPTGILREAIAFEYMFSFIPLPSKSEMNGLYDKTLGIAYCKGVTGVHSFDSPIALPFYLERAEKNTLGLRINHYPRVQMLPDLIKSKTRYGTGTEFFRFAGIKLFADGTLGSQTALCFKPFIGSKNNCGIETASKSDMLLAAKQAAHLGFPCAIHAIGDKAVSNVLDVYESAPRLMNGARHRIEHLQLIRRSDIARFKKLHVIASMQPSHCPSDIEMIHRSWGKRGKDTYLFKTLRKRGIHLAFGSDVPIEPLDPLAGIAAAVRRSLPNKRTRFYPEERLSVTEAIHGFTAGAAYACGQEHCRGYLQTGYPADLTILEHDITAVTPARVENTEILATIIDGEIKYLHSSLKL